MNYLIPREEILKIIETCRQYGIKEYDINPDGSLYVNGPANLAYRDLTELPLNFDTVVGDFSCHGNQLTTLKGSPKTIGGSFYCYENLLPNMKFCPQDIYREFQCSDNRLTSLKGMPDMLRGKFICANNRLKDLSGGPTIVKGLYYDVQQNKLNSLHGAPTQFFGDFNIDSNMRIPNEFHIQFKRLRNYHDISVFLKYQDYYELWKPEFNVKNLTDLVDDILDDLK